MGKEIVYCDECATRIVEDEYQKGKAIIVAGKNYCGACKSKAPVPATAPVPAGRAMTPPSSRRLPVPLRGARPSPPRATPPPEGKKAGIIIGGAVAATLIAGIAVTMMSGQKPKSPPKQPVPPPEIVEAPVPAPAPPPVVARPRPAEPAPTTAPAGSLNRKLEEIVSINLLADLDKSIALFKSCEQEADKLGRRKEVDHLRLQYAGVIQEGLQEQVEQSLLNAESMIRRRDPAAAAKEVDITLARVKAAAYFYDSGAQVKKLEAMKKAGEEAAAMRKAGGAKPRGLSGARWRYYEGGWNTIPDFDSLTAKKTGAFTDGGLRIDPRDRDTEYGLVFEAKVVAAVEGNYEFIVRSDDGSRLVIDSKIVVDHDGLRGAEPPGTGEAYLTKGTHTLLLEFFQNQGGFGLEVQWTGPDFDTEVLKVAGK